MTQLIADHARGVAITANAMSGDEERARAAGCDDFMTKPIDEDVLFATLHRWLG